MWIMSMSALMSALRGAGRQHLTASTVTARQTVTGSHVFRIQGYTQVRKAVPAGTAINSTKFRIGGQDWKINCYPNGSDDTNEIDGKFMSVFTAKNKYISLYLENLGGGATGEFDLSVLDRAGRPLHTVNSKQLPMSRYNLGWGKFVKNDKLDLVDDCLVVLCDLTVNPSPSAAVPEPTAAAEAASTSSKPTV